MAINAILEQRINRIYRDMAHNECYPLNPLFCYDKYILKADYQREERPEGGRWVNRKSFVRRVAGYKDGHLTGEADVAMESAVIWGYNDNAVLCESMEELS